jgi:hypothetical protein
MKRPATLTIVTLLVVVALLTGCRHLKHDGVKGSGNRAKQKRDVGAFTSITTEGAFDVEVVCQKEQSVEIEGDDDILPLVSTEVSGGVLRLKPLRNYSTDDNIVVRITVPNLEGINAGGVGKMHIKDIKNEKFEIDANGAPNVTASGETNTLTIDANGAGKVDARSLRASKATVEANGVARIEVNASERLDVQINGPAHVSYSGEPEINQTIHGPGTLEKREGSGA